MRCMDDAGLAYQNFNFSISPGPPGSCWIYLARGASRLDLAVDADRNITGT
jgi:hypothetical protein